MKVGGVGHLEGARSMGHFWGEICLILRHFLGTLTEMGPIHWVYVQTWPPRGGSFNGTLFGGNLHHFAPLFGNTDRDGSYTLGRCTNLAAKQP